MSNTGNCNNQTCGNPCSVDQFNTAACESLPSQIQNFTDQFFGTVVKTEVDGVVTWTLPCDLDTGLPNNPRAAGEGLACYFLRLFMDGIIGLTGPKGDPGNAGTNGRDAFTITLTSFTQPTLDSPVISIVSYYNPVIYPGLYVFITGSGWYIVNTADIAGNLSLTLVKPLSGVTGLVSSGKFLVPSGFPGESIKGDKGDPGPKGDTGPAGNTVTSTNGYFWAPSGSNFSIQIASSAVTFISYVPSVLLPKAGTYKVTMTAGVKAIGSVIATDSYSLKLRNTTDSVDVGNPTPPINNQALNQISQVVIDAIFVVSADNTTVALFASASSNGVFEVQYQYTSISWVRIA